MSHCQAVDNDVACGGAVKARGLCSKHYARWLKRGFTALSAQARTRLTTEQARPVMIANGFLPIGEYPGNARTGWPSICLAPDCGKATSPTYDNIRRRGHTCKWCSRTVIDPDEAAQLMRAAGLDPLTPYPGRNSTPWPCRCQTCHDVVTPCYSSVITNGAGCNSCGNRRAGDARRTSGGVAVAIMRAAGLEPLEPFEDSKTPWRCLCLSPECGKEVSPTLTRVKAGAQCAYCRGNRVDGADAVEVMVANGLQPLEPYPGSGNPWLCRCITCGFIRPVYYDNIKQGIGICPSCADFGIDYSAPGSLYVVTDFELVKVGIANNPRLAARLSEHRRQGLPELVYTEAFATALDAKRVEDTWKHFVRSRRVNGQWEVPPTRLAKSKGHTETAKVGEDAIACLLALLPSLRWPRPEDPQGAAGHASNDRPLTTMGHPLAT